MQYLFMLSVVYWTWEPTVFDLNALCKTPLILPNFLMRKFCGNVQIRRVLRKPFEYAHFSIIATLGDWKGFRYFEK